MWYASRIFRSKKPLHLSKIQYKIYKIIKLDYATCPIFYTGLHLSHILIQSNLPTTSEPRPVISQTVCDNCCKNNCICDIRRVIYSIQCNMCLINNCNDKSYIGSYIGETGGLLKFKINERKKAVLKEDISNSSMAVQFKLLNANTTAGDRTFIVNFYCTDALTHIPFLTILQCISCIVHICIFFSCYHFVFNL